MAEAASGIATMPPMLVDSKSIIGYYGLPSATFLPSGTNFAPVDDLTTRCDFSSTHSKLYNLGISGCSSMLSVTIPVIIFR
jgi:hypothetical protein